jgi:hypothetical protein
MRDPERIIDQSSDSFDAAADVAALLLPLSVCSFSLLRGLDFLL